MNNNKEKVVVLNTDSDEVSPQQLLIQTMNNVDDIEDLIIIYNNKQGWFGTGWSTMSISERLGLLEMGKQSMFIEASNKEDEV